MAQLTTRQEHMQAIKKKFKTVDFEMADMWPASQKGCTETFVDANMGLQVRTSQYVKARSGDAVEKNQGLFSIRARLSQYEIIAQYVGDRSAAKYMDVTSDYTFEITYKSKRIVIDARDPTLSSVARYVNCGSLFSRNNCVFYNHQANVYLVRVKPMKADEEFLAPYEKEDDIEKWSLRVEGELTHMVDDSVKQEVYAHMQVRVNVQSISQGVRARTHSVTCRLLPRKCKSRMRQRYVCLLGGGNMCIAIFFSSKFSRVPPILKPQIHSGKEALDKAHKALIASKQEASLTVSTI